MALAIHFRAMPYRETQWPIGSEFIISQAIIKLLLESPLNIWDSTLARSLPRARCASLASISRVGASAKGKRILPSVEAPRRSAPLRAAPSGHSFRSDSYLAARFFTRAPLALSRLASIFPLSRPRPTAIPAIRGRAVCVRSNVPFSRLSAGARLAT
jgi:hypothetical protein